MAETFAIKKWLENRSSLWQEYDKLYQYTERGKGIQVNQAAAFVNGYQEIARDLSLARKFIPDSRICRYLSNIYADFHQSIHRRPPQYLRGFKRFFRDEIPQAVHAIRWQILVVTAIFLASGLAGWLLVFNFPELATLFASERMIDTVSKGGLWTDDLINIVPSSLLSVGIFTNNISVALTACCMGALFGLGTIYIIALNGLMLGGIFAFTYQYQLAHRLFEFIVAHGIVELSVICVAGAVGASIGEALARPGLIPRRVAFEIAAKRGMKLMAICILFLIGAGIIEGYVSPNPLFGLNSRIIIGICYMLLFIAVLAGPWKAQEN